MASATIINKFGRIVGWNNITMTLYGRDVEAITEVSYNDEQDMENEYGQGKYPMGQGEMNYKANFSFSLYHEELLAIQRSLPPGIRIQDIPPTDVIINYEHNGTTYKDVVRNVRLKNNGREVKQGDGKIVFKVDCLTSHIDWNA